MTQGSDHDVHPREPADLTRRELLRYGLVGGTTVFFLGASRASAAIWRAMPAPKNKPARLIVRNWGDPWKSFFASAAGKSFTKQTGIPVVWDTTDGHVIQEKIKAAIKSGQRPPVDAVMNDSSTGYLAYVQKLSALLDPKIITNLGSYNPGVAKPGFGIRGYAFLGMYTFSVPLNYRTDKVQPDALKSWNDLLAPGLAKRIAVPHSYQWLTFPMAKTMGINPATQSLDPVFAKLKELRPNILALANDTQMTNFLTTGDAWIALCIPGDGFAAHKAGAPVGIAVPDEGIVIDRDVYYILKNTPPEVRYYGNVFANHIIATANQSKMATTLGVTPGALKAKLPAYMKANPAAFPITSAQLARNIILPSPLVAKNADKWQAQFDEALK